MVYSEHQHEKTNHTTGNDSMFILTFSPALLWLFAAIILLVLELGTPGLFVFICFALGAFFGAGLAALNFSLPIQCYGALAFAVFHFYTVRRRLLRFTQARHAPTNSERLVGQHGVVVRAIEPGSHGHVKIGGEEWVAESSTDETIKKGTLVQVLRVRGNRVVVKKISLTD